VSILTGLALIPLVVWAALLSLRGGFWRADQQLKTPGFLDSSADRERWPSVIAVIPARNEAKTVGKVVSSLLVQDYPGAFGVVLVDDGSDDGTAEKAGKAANGSVRFSVIKGKPLAPGWTGKLWAMAQGLEQAALTAPDCVYVLLCDADIVHDPANLRRLVAKAEGEALDMVSLMVMLRCKNFWERLLIPAFVFFFQKLYPFPWVNDPLDRTAAAAGGCMLVRRSAIDKAGGLEAIRSRLIDDCALAALIKKNGPIWLGLTEHVHSLRAYKRLGEIRSMVARTAFVQLNYSVWRLVGAVFAMILTYLGPPSAAVAGIFMGDPLMFLGGVIAWFLMVFAYDPTLELYGQPAWRGMLLPLAALLYTLMTVDSAIQHWRGRGGMWKGRSYGTPTDGGG